MLLTDTRITEIALLGILAGFVGTGAYLLPWLVNDPVHRETIIIAVCFTLLIVVFMVQAARYLDLRKDSKPTRKAQ